MSYRSTGRLTHGPLMFVAITGLVVAALTGCSTQQDRTPSPVRTPTGATHAPVDSAPATTRATTGSLFGSWESSDGTDKTFGSNGSCKGFFYDSSTGKPLDIGGPSSCELSSSQDDTGRYRLKVTQGPNRGTYLVEFHGDDTATVYTKSGTELYRLTRF